MRALWPSSDPKMTVLSHLSRQGIRQRLANANNALADANALNFQNYYTPSLYGVPDANSNAMNLRGVIVSGSRIIRATLPISMVPSSQNTISILGQVPSCRPALRCNMNPDWVTSLSLTPLLTVVGG